MVVPRRPLIADVFRRHVGRIHDALAWRVAFAYEPMVRAKAVRFLGCGLDLEDLVQEGLIGMHRAAQLYDPTKGPLSTHLACRSKAAMVDAIVREGRIVRIPRWADQAARRIQRGAGDISSAGTAKRRECILAAIDIRSRRIGDDTVDVADVAGSVEPDLLVEMELHRKVLDAIDRLDDRARAVIRARYLGAMTLTAAGKTIGVGRDWTRTIEMRALADLRTMLADIASDP